MELKYLWNMEITILCTHSSVCDCLPACHQEIKAVSILAQLPLLTEELLPAARGEESVFFKGVVPDRWTTLQQMPPHP